jgi:hypothetical protein
LSFARQNQDDLNLLRLGHNRPFLDGRKVDRFHLQIFPGAADACGHDLDVSTVAGGRSRSESRIFAYCHGSNDNKQFAGRKSDVWACGLVDAMVLSGCRISSNLTNQ